MTDSRFKLFSMAGVALLALASCSNDELQEINGPSDLISFNTRVSRADETTITTLQKDPDGFLVYADVKGYADLTINGENAVYNTATGNFELAKEHRWTPDMRTIKFWAFYPGDAVAEGDRNVSATEVALRSFVPEASMDNPGAKQKDLIISYAKVDYGSVPNNNVPLVFDHALSQIEIHAVNKATDDEQVVKILGGAIVNVVGKGNLFFDENGTLSLTEYQKRYPVKDKDDNTKYNIIWGKGINPQYENYGITLNSKTRLTLKAGESDKPVFGGDEDNSSLMLIPQTTVPYSFEAPLAANTVPGSYILLLCRVEIEHPGLPTDDLTGDASIFTDEQNNKHYHQLFPKVTTKGKYDANHYAYTCVPITFNWQPGYRYVYTLNFLGQSSGAGQYPPTDHPEIPVPDGITVIDPDPSNPEQAPGMPVLDRPITFNVSVSEWRKAPGSDINMQ